MGILIIAKGAKLEIVLPSEDTSSDEGNESERNHG